MKLGTHNGVVNYGQSASAAIRFLDHEKFEPFSNAVKGLVKIGGGTRIDLALEAVHDHLWPQARKALSIPKVAVSIENCS